MLATPVLIYEWLNKTFCRNHAAHHFCPRNVQQKNKSCVLSPSAKSKHFENTPFSFPFDSVSSPNFRSPLHCPLLRWQCGHHHSEGLPPDVEESPFTLNLLPPFWLCTGTMGEEIRPAVLERRQGSLCTRFSPASQWWSTLTRWTFLMGWTGRWITKPSSTLTACPTRWMLLIMTSKLEKLVWVVVFQNNCLCLKIVMFVSTLFITQMIRALGALIQKPL